MNIPQPPPTTPGKSKFQPPGFARLLAHLPSSAPRRTIFEQISDEQAQLNVGTLLAHSCQRLLRVLDKERKQRTPGDLDWLQLMLQEIAFFKERQLSPQELSDVAGCMRHEAFGPGANVITIGR